MISVSQSSNSGPLNLITQLQFISSAHLAPFAPIRSLFRLKWSHVLFFHACQARRASHSSERLYDHQTRYNRYRVAIYRTDSKPQAFCGEVCINHFSFLSWIFPPFLSECFIIPFSPKNSDLPFVFISHVQSGNDLEFTLAAAFYAHLKMNPSFFKVLVFGAVAL